MFDDPEELLDKIRLGEDSFLEFKEARVAGRRVFPHRDAIADELAAFANSRGGVYVLGVRDGSRQVVGIPLEDLEMVERCLHEVCSDAVDPPLTPVIERLWLPGESDERLPVIKVTMPRSLFVHRSPGGYLHRVGSAKRIMPTDYLARLFQQRSQTRMISFDEQTVADATLDDLSPALWERFRTPRSSDEKVDLLTKLGILGRDDTGVARPSVAGLLMASEAPQRWMPNAFIQAVAYKGDMIGTGSADAPYQLDASNITGPLDTQIVDACRFVTRNMKTAAFKHMGRLDLPQYDMAAVFEAIVNAVAHRDYSIHGSKVRLRLFNSRLEIFSPGTIPNTMTVASLPYRQSARNETVTSLLARCPIPETATWIETDRQTMMDKRGEGVRIVLDRSERLSGRTPEYRLIDDAELMLTIHASDPEHWVGANQLPSRSTPPRRPEGTQ